MAQSSSLLRLPQEILDGITSNLEPRDLSCFSSSCQQVRAATLPTVYRDIRMIWRGSRQPSENRPRSDCKHESCPRLDLLLRTLLENQALAELVRTLDLQSSGYWSYELDGRLPYLPSYIPSNSELFKNAFRRTGSPIPKFLDDDIERCDLHVVVGLTILATPKLSSLTLGLDMIHRNDCLPYVLMSALTLPLDSALSDLSSRERLTLGVDYDWDRFPEDRSALEDLEWDLDLPLYLPFFYLPNLKEVEMNLPGGQDYYRGYFGDSAITRGSPRSLWPLSWPPRADSIRTLRLLKAHASHDLVEQVLMVTPNLVSLEYDCVCFSWIALHASRLASALKLVKRTLVALKVTLKSWSAESTLIQENYGFHTLDVVGHCSLKDMPALTTVDVVPEVLLGMQPRGSPRLADVLPYGIVSLRIRGDCVEPSDTPDGRPTSFYHWHPSEVMCKLREFVDNERWREATPRLQRIGILWRLNKENEWDEDDTIWTMTEEPVELCTRNGLACQVAESDEEFDES
ncbi:uncharacterized protein EI97DRAFT_430435 [Westerdykella ornata]|uniref:F-box domain-containing protein n=1 Tax=Westerdykella ornata TaxID=318751 RepID=A0A6A6JS14_WESOR|nr:uncharacterized protein EI97DRAFT_430435 [Westerdykella ornata]KAF2279352.1 hypothetical protein EI97DRAFT_430435 [Westerdykella ornata]